jgi:hypothetical protein
MERVRFIAELLYFGFVWDCKETETSLVFLWLLGWWYKLHCRTRTEK